MSNYLYEQVKKYFETAIPPTVNIERTLYPGQADKIFTPSRILKSGNRTIVFWSDGTKTIVKRAEDEPDNDYAAFTAALGIKIFGSNSALRRTIKRKTTVQAKK